MMVSYQTHYIYIYCEPSVKMWVGDAAHLTFLLMKCLAQDQKGRRSGKKFSM